MVYPITAERRHSSSAASAFFNPTEVWHPLRIMVS